MAAYVGKLPALSTLLARLSLTTSERKAVALEGALLAQRIGVPLRPMSEAAKQALLKLNRES